MTRSGFCFFVFMSAEGRAPKHRPSRELRASEVSAGGGDRFLDVRPNVISFENTCEH